MMNSYKASLSMSVYHAPSKRDDLCPSPFSPHGIWNCFKITHRHIRTSLWPPLCLIWIITIIIHNLFLMTSSSYQSLLTSSSCSYDSSLSKTYKQTFVDFLIFTFLPSTTWNWIGIIIISLRIFMTGQ
jgi:hypothetical protein